MLKPVEHIENITLNMNTSLQTNCDMKLDLNENYIGPSTCVIQAIKNLDPLYITRYPNYDDLYKTIAEFHHVEPHSIAISNGLTDAVWAILSSFWEKNDIVVTVTPAETPIFSAVQLHGAELQEIPYKNKWIYPYEQVKEALCDDKVKALYLCTPNNPTGDMVPEHYIEEFVCAHPNKLFIIDESFGNFSGYTNIDLAKKYDNVFWIKSCSFDYGLAGLRFAYIVSEMHNIECVNKFLSKNAVNIVAAIATKASIEDKNYIRYVANEIARSRAFLTEEIRKLGFDVYRSYGNFILVDFKSKADLIYKKFVSNNIVVKNYFDDSVLNGHLRITIPTASAAERLIALLKSRNTLVFDLDNILFDVSESAFKAIKMTYLHFTGKNISDYDLNRMRALLGTSNPQKLLIDVIKRSGFNFANTDVLNVYNEYYSIDGMAFIDNETLLIEPNIIKKLSEQYNMAICTERSLQDTMFVLKKYNIDRYFSKIITADSVPETLRFPDTTPLLMIKEAFITDYLICFCGASDFAKSAIKFNYSVPVGVEVSGAKSSAIVDSLKNVGVEIFVSDFQELLAFTEQCM